MLMNIANKDIKTFGYVIKRTNYGEADRILNLITPLGKISVIAKGVRKEKSKLAGSVELFTLADFMIHKGKSDIAVLTSAKMCKYYSNILKSFDRMELAGRILKRVGVVADSSDNADYYRIVDQSLMALNDGLDVKLVESWYLLNLLKAMGDEVNLYRDQAGAKLDALLRYNFDIQDNCFIANENGLYGADEIKLLRLLSSTDLVIVSRVKNLDSLLDELFKLVRVMAKM